MDVLSISPLTVRYFGAERSPKQINHRVGTERQHRCNLAPCTLLKCIPLLELTAGLLVSQVFKLYSSRETR